MSGIDLARLDLVEELRFNLTEAKRACPIRDVMNLGWGFLYQGIALLTPLRSPLGEDFAIRRGSYSPQSEELYALGISNLEQAFSELAAEVYAPPKRTGTHVDQLECIMVDANEVVRLIIKWGNQSAFLRVLLERLFAELRQTLGTGSRVKSSAETAVRAVLEQLIEISIKLNQSALGVPESGALFIEANRLYGELGRLLKVVTEEFRRMREDEKTAGKGDHFHIGGNVGNLVTGNKNVTTLNQTAGATAGEILELLAQLRTAVQVLPLETRQDAIDYIDGIEVEAKAEKPSKGKLRSFLSSLKETAEAGNEVAGFGEKVIPLIEKLGPLVVALIGAAVR